MLPCLAVDGATVISGNIGIRVYEGRVASIPDNTWKTAAQGYTSQGIPNLRYSYATQFEAPWYGRKITSVIEFWGPPVANGTLEFCWQPYSEG